MSYSEILKDEKGKVLPNTLGVKLKCVRKTRNKDFLIEVSIDAGGKT